MKRIGEQFVFDIILLGGPFHGVCYRDTFTGVAIEYYTGRNIFARYEWTKVLGQRLFGQFAGCFTIVKGMKLRVLNYG